MTATTSAFGFHADPGTDWSKGDEPIIAAALDRLAKRKHINIYGLSGSRTPEHSVEVGGFANDPHTKGAAGDIAVDGHLRASAGSLSDADLASVGLYRPFPGAAEINHVQIKPDSRSTLSKVFNAPEDAGKAVGHAINGLLGLSDPDPTKGIGERAQDAGHDASHAAQDEVTGAVSGAITSLFSGFFDSVKAGAPKALIFLLFTVGGLVMAAYGTARLFGVQEPVKSTIGVARKVAVAGAAA